MPSFVDKLRARVQQEYPSLTDLDKFLRQSRAAASYDAIVMLALALDETLECGNFETGNISMALNTTLSSLKMNGLAVRV